MTLQLLLDLEPDVPLLPGLITLDSPEEDWDIAISQFRNCQAFALDIETMKAPHQWAEHDKDALVPFRADVRLIQVGLQTGTCIVIDLGSNALDDRDAIAANPRFKEFIELLRINCFDRTVWVIGHNLFFESSMLYYHYGIKIRCTFDTLIASRMMYAGLSKKYDNIAHDLGSVIYRELGESPDKSQGKEFDWRLPIKNRQMNYAMNDVLYPLRLAKKMKKYISGKAWREAALIEFEAAVILGEMYVNGYPVDIDMVDEAINQYEKCQSEAILPFSKAFPYTKPTALTKTIMANLREIGYSDAVYDSQKDFKQNIEPFKNVPEAKAIIDWRSYEKPLQYLRNMRESYINGAVHGYYNSYSPKGTGRTTCGSNIRNGSKAIASTGINLQNPPKPLYGRLGNGWEKAFEQFSLGNLWLFLLFKNPDAALGWLQQVGTPASLGIKHLISVRECFRHPDPNYGLIIEDLPQAHLYIATESSNDPTLIKSYRENIDQHSLVGAKLANIKGYNWDWEYINARKGFDKLCKEFRNGGKTANYSALNLAGVKTMAESNGLLIEEAKQIKQAHQATFPVLHEFLAGLIKRANSEINYNLLADHRAKVIKQLNAYNNYGIARSFDGRELFMKKWDTKYGESVNASESTAFHWLACEATIIKGALRDVQYYLDDHPEIDAALCNLVHDELNAWCRKDQIEDLSYFMHSATLFHMKKFITKFPIDGDNQTEHLKAIGTCWADK